MSDDERQAQALRHGLDRELASVRASAQARERLVGATTAGNRAERRVGQPSRRPLLALPLAGALVAAVIAAAVGVPSLLRTDTEVGVPAGVPAPGLSIPHSATPTAEQSGSPTAEPTPTEPQPVTVRPSSVRAQPTAGTGAALRLSASPSSPEVGARVVVSLRGVPRGRGEATVDWGDRSAGSTVPGSCTETAPPTVANPLSHRYGRAGRFKITVVLDRCGTREEAHLTVVVRTPTPTATPTATR